MSSTTTDSQESVIFVCEQKTMHVEVHNQPSHVPDTPPQNLNQNQNSTSSPENTGQQEEEDDCFIVPETTGKNIHEYTHHNTGKS